jgi:hypothetical protein
MKKLFYFYFFNKFILKIEKILIEFDLENDLEGFSGLFEEQFLY